MNEIVNAYFSLPEGHTQPQRQLTNLLTQKNCDKCIEAIIKKFKACMQEAEIPAKITLLERLRVITDSVSKEKLTKFFHEQLKVASDVNTLLEACYVGNLPLAQAIHGNGVTLNIKTQETGFTPLHYAAHLGCGPMLDWLLLAKAPLEAKAGPFERTPLHLACASGKGLAMAKLLKGGALLETPDKNGCTPLHLAFSRQDIKQDSLLCARLGLFLYCRGANPQAISDKGFLPVDCILKPLDREKYDKVQGRLAQIRGQDSGAELERKILETELEEIKAEQFTFLGHAFTKYEPLAENKNAHLPGQVWQVIMRHLPRDFILDRLRRTCKTLNNYVLEYLIRDFQQMSVDPSK